MTPTKNAHIQIPRNCEYVKLHSNRDFANEIKIIDLKMRRLFWIIQVDPTESSGHLKAENFLSLQLDKCRQAGWGRLPPAWLGAKNQGMWIASRSWL